MIELIDLFKMAANSDFYEWNEIDIITRLLIQ